MHIDKQRSRSDAEFYQMNRQAEANKLLLTPEYLELRKVEAIANNNKIYFGSEIPKMFIQSGSTSSESLSQCIKEVPEPEVEKVEPY